MTKIRDTTNYNARRFKSLSVRLKELEPFIRNGEHLQNGRPYRFHRKGMGRVTAELDPFVTQHMDALYDFLPLMGLVPNT
jgi:hypothetical protein